MAGDKDDRPSSTASIEVLHQIEPGHARHPDIGYDAIKRLQSIERGQKLLGGLEARRADSLPGQILLQCVEHCPFVVYQRNTDMISHAPIVASKDAKNAVRLKVAAALLLNTLKI